MDSPGQEGDGGMSSLGTGAIASIVLGVLLVVLVIATIVICLLIKKGYLRTKSGQLRSKVIPGLSSIRSRMSSVRSSKGRPEQPPPKKDEKDPIIYLYDDIYRPPRSLALPEQFKKKETHTKAEPRRTRPHARAHAQSNDTAHQPVQTIPQVERVTEQKEDEEDLVVVPDTTPNYQMLGNHFIARDPEDAFARSYD